MVVAQAGGCIWMKGWSFMVLRPGFELLLLWISSHNAILRWAIFGDGRFRLYDSKWDEGTLRSGYRATIELITTTRHEKQDSG